MIHQSHVVGAIGENDLAIEVQEFAGLEPVEAEEEGGAPGQNVIRARENYVRQCLLGSKLKRSDSRRDKHEGANESRREVIKDFLSAIVVTRVCSNCGGISPTYRKDRSVKLFEKALSDKEKGKMVQKALLREDAMARVHLNNPKRKRENHAADEGVADLDSPPSSKQSPNAGSESDEEEIESVDQPSVVFEPSANTEPSQRYISPMEVKARLAELFVKEQDLLYLLYNARPATRSSARLAPDMFFLSTILVSPNRFRPEARTGENEIAEAQQNNLYKSILRGCGRIAKLHSTLVGSSGDINQLHQAWTELQEAVNSLIDKDQNPVQGAAAKRNEDGIKQMLEKKEGLFRKNMMGKRVNYAARSVISPDPNIETNEIGVPPVFAKKLTYPEPVTSHNFRDMQQAVINGTDKWPGAFAIENENGQIVNLRNKSVDDRISLANQLLAPSTSNAARSANKKVYRHLTNGDVVLMNRQPTLHKPSIMGHRVRVLPGEKTIRMHYANCNTYNADFDGDEMNMHFPQNEVARAEALQIADTDHQYLSATAGKPLRGLIQDHISVSVALCNRDTFFNRGDYHQLIYGALRPENGHILSERLQLVPPAIIKPSPRWTGKQVFTTILKNIQPPDCGGLTVKGETQLKAEQWGTKSEEATVLISDGEFITGILDKSQLGPSSGGVIHAVHEVYGPAVAGKLLSSMGRLLTRYLGMRAFSCGMDDLRLTSEGEISRLEHLKAAPNKGLEIASEYVSLEDCKNDMDPILQERLEEVLRDNNKQEGLDLLMNQGTREITDAVQQACIPGGLEKPFPKNQMQAMTTSGAKGSRVNASLISCNLGQQVLEGRRVPLMVSGKTLPCFKAFETDIRAGGYIVNRFLTGIRPQEYYFHHMAGREGLIDTAVKTSRSGYLQRCVIKGMEGLTVAYDTTVRDADGSMIQFLYGEDGLDTTRQKYLTDFTFVLQNVKSEVARLSYDSKLGERLGSNRDEFSKYMKRATKHVKDGRPTTRDPLISQCNPATNALVTSEKFYMAMANYMKDNTEGLLREKGDKSINESGRIVLNRKNAEMLFAMKYLRSLVEPGEAVGIVAGQSVGEPSTQMTLNTFHLAGHSAKNVTLGIPRLREILMTASKVISTPAMTLYPVEGLSSDEVVTFAKSISILPLGDLLDFVAVDERVGQGKMYSLSKTYTIKLRFFPSSEYTQVYGISISNVMDTVERKLVRNIVTLIKKEIKKRVSLGTNSTPEVGVKSGTVEMAHPTTAAEGAGRDEDDDGGDDDATASKQRGNRQEAVSYGPNDDEDDVVQRLNAQETMTDDSNSNEDEEEGVSKASIKKLSAKNTIKEGSGFIANQITHGDVGGDDSDSARANRDAAPGAGERSERVLEDVREATGFDCDEEHGEWCSLSLEYDFDTPKVLMLNLVQTAIKKTVVQQISGVGACTRLEEKGGGSIIQTAGVNIKAMQRLGDFINPHKIQTNDIGEVLEVYGVEACRSNVVQELAGVFGSHGIAVDNRHLNLIADHMTRNGDYTAFSRMGLKGNVSPFTKMSFETTLAFLKDAVLDGDWDDLTTPSSRLVMGKLGRVGTGGFDVLTSLPTHHANALS